MAIRTLEARNGRRDSFDGESLLRLALSMPLQAIDEAEGLLRERLDPLTSSYALQALSVAHRELGHGGTALRHARRALRAARASGRADRPVDVQATLGVVLARTGRTREALTALDAAVAESKGAVAARSRVRRASVLFNLGRHAEVLADVNASLPVLRAAGDAVYQARALGWRALAHDGLGDPVRADRDQARCERLLHDQGQHLESAFARHTRGLFAHRAGDLPAALRHFDVAEQMYTVCGDRDGRLELARCATLLAAGMPEEARQHATRAAELLSDVTADADAHAEAFLTAASAAIAAGAAGTAVGDAATAERLFRRQGNELWALHSQRVGILAELLRGRGDARLLRSARSVADRLDELNDPDIVEARLLAGRVALAVGDVAAARDELSRAARARRRGPVVGRVTGWLAAALDAEARGDRRALLTACRRGLDLLDQHLLGFGATEMRARATVHGGELATVAVRQAAGASDARRLLEWSERWRATALAAAPVRPPDDHELGRDLSSLRSVVARITEARSEGRPTARLEQEQSRLEAAIRNRMLRTSGTGQRAAGRFDLAAVRAELGDTTLVELVDVDGQLHAVTVDRRATRMQAIGPTEAAVSELEYARFGLRRIAEARSDALVRVAARSLHAAAADLEAALLGPVARRLGDGPVLIVPSGRLHAVPWSLLPSLAEREVTVAPSATSWLRARTTQAPRQGRVALVVGPELATEGAEVDKVAPFYERAQLLTGSQARAEEVLAVLDGCSLAHVAAHGTFRADNPLFSSLRMSDGPLTVHDLERLRRPPYRLVLSSCDSGLSSTAGADELLGLSSALIGLGSAGLLSSVVIVNDAATVSLMVAVHERLRQGATLAAALHGARMELGDDDPVLAATGQSFIALGGA